MFGEYNHQITVYLVNTITEYTYRTGVINSSF